MAQTASVPILLCGQIDSHIEAAITGFRPEFEVVHVAGTNEDAIAYLKSKPAPKPQIAIMGGEYTHEDLLEIQSAGAPLAKQISWVRPEHTKPGSQLQKDRTAVASSATVVRSVKAMLVKVQEQLAGEGKGQEGHEGDVWYFGMVEEPTTK